MNIKNVRFAILIIFALLAGCATTKDPTKAGLFDTMQNVHQGEYEKQEKELEAEVERTTLTKEELSAEVTRLKWSKQELEAQKVSMQRQVTKQKELNKQLKASLKRLKKSKNANTEKVKALNTKLADLKKECNSVFDLGTITPLGLAKARLCNAKKVNVMEEIKAAADERLEKL